MTGRPGESGASWVPSRWVVAGALSLALVVSGCSDDDSEPDSVAVKSGPGWRYGLSSSGVGPAAGWVDVGERVAITLLGSSSCPPVPTDVEADSRTVTVMVSQDYEGVCTADLAPYSSLVELDEPIAVRGPVDLVIRQDDARDVTIQLAPESVAPNGRS